MQNQSVTGEVQTGSGARATPDGVADAPLSWIADTDLVRVLRTRAGYAREEGTGTAIGDALHFEAAADAIERLLADRPQMGGAA